MPSDFEQFLNNNFDIDTDELNQRAQDWYRTRPGFFTPYKNPGDFLETLTAPVVAPVVLGLTSAFFFTISGVAACATGVSLLVGGLSLLTASEEGFYGSLACAGISLITAGASFLFGAALAIAAIASIPLSLIELGTRTAATLVNPIIDCVADDESRMELVL